MTIFKDPLRPPVGAVLEDLRLNAVWSVVKKRDTDPDHTGWPRLSFISTEAAKKVGIKFTSSSYTTAWDTERHGLWLHIYPTKKLALGTAAKFAIEKKRTRCNFNKMTGLFKHMGTEDHFVDVEIWTLRKARKVTFWLFAPMKHAEGVGQFKGSRLVE